MCRGSEEGQGMEGSDHEKQSVDRCAGGVGGGVRCGGEQNRSYPRIRGQTSVEGILSGTGNLRTGEQHL